MWLFLESHRCNAICRHLGLSLPEDQQQGAGAAWGSHGAAAAPAYVPVHGNLCAPPRQEFSMLAAGHMSSVIFEEDSSDFDPDYY